MLSQRYLNISIVAGGMVWRAEASTAGARFKEAPEPEETDSSLQETARVERDYLRRRLREELQREPTEEELNEWLRQHTEGY